MSLNKVGLRIYDFNKSLVKEKEMLNTDAAYSYFCKQNELDPDSNCYYMIYDLQTKELLRGF